MVRRIPPYTDIDSAYHTHEEDPVIPEQIQPDTGIHDHCGNGIWRLVAFFSFCILSRFRSASIRILDMVDGVPPDLLYADTRRQGLVLQ